MTKSSASIWHLLSKCQIDAEDFVIFVAFLENMNFKISSDENNNNPKITL